jgi:hypothetical protein
MSAIITNQFRKNSRELFINDINNTGTDDYFIGIGKSEPWPTITEDGNTIDENSLAYSVPLPLNTIVEREDVLKNLISLVKVQNTFAVIPRNEWRRNRIYKVYDTTDPNIFNYETITGVPYYPCYMTRNDKVYLCLSNNNGSPSTVNFTIQSGEDDYASPKTLDDNYVWAYVCDLTETSEFYTDQFVDIPADLVDTSKISQTKASTGGMVYGFKVIDGGDEIDATDVTIKLVGSKFDTDGVVIPADDVTIFTNNAAITGYSITISEGAVTSITFTDADNQPTGYLDASIIVVGKETNIQPLVAPIEGVGFSPQSNLPSFYAGLASSYIGSDNGESPIGIGFRQVSLVQNPSRIDNDNPDAGDNDDDTLDNYDTLQYFVMNDINNVPTAPGTIIEHTATGAKAYVDYVVTAGSENRIYYHQNSSAEINQKRFDSGSVKFTTPAGTVTDSGHTIQSAGLVAGEYTQGSGKALFLENRRAIIRNSNQQEDIKLVIQF